MDVIEGHHRFSSYDDVARHVGLHKSAARLPVANGVCDAVESDAGVPGDARIHHDGISSVSWTVSDGKVEHEHGKVRHGAM
jgi:hypothetical protein